MSRYLYIIILTVVLTAMFVFGDRIQSSPDLVYTEKAVIGKSSDSFCSEEVDKYKKELKKAQQQINQLNSVIKQSRLIDPKSTSYAPR